MSTLDKGESMLVAHEWLAETGGSENCYEQMLIEFPAAATAILWNDAPDRFPNIDQETWLARSPLRRSKVGALPFMPRAWRGIELGSAEVVLASSHMFSHLLAGRAVREGRRGFAYVHTPLRYVWAPEVDMRGDSLPVRAASKLLKPIDRKGTSPAVQYAANSDYIRRRIEKSWGRESVVINPCVDVDGAAAVVEAATDEDYQLLTQLPDQFLLGVSRMVEYKRLDLVIQVGATLSMPVVIVGTGEDEARLREVATDAGVPVHFVGRVSDAVLQMLYRDAAALIFPPVEDFGIVPVEAIAWGTPVVVGSEGGAREAIERTGGGRIAPGDQPAAFAEAAREALAVDMNSARASASYYSSLRFRREVRSWIEA